ncbi:acyltransferase family protein [Aurantiacibacter zhengii]|uniref:Acyltransferase n=1 Tax=Aurantiacibacter zhengii TaxID=2307003 RepID=A0A418NN88_9SPHN|nr:acyltransferase family protein [Aurantiacibacter zhengii]RIV83050.1 acyltransferase [Aurantiacibacter zhengii]
MRYRTEIDGLRAVAVLPIVLFHAGVSQLKGGFIGVDIFFVISGFLITNIIMREIDEGQFSLLEFYKRRVVRILPALFAMMAALLLATWIFVPFDLPGITRSAAAAAGFISNIYFWWNTDYFARAGEAEPLLHTWSLGVEEQFYIFYPLLLLALRRRSPRTVLRVLFAIVAISFAISLALTIRAPAAGFYTLPSRAWELGLGGVVALGGFPKVRNYAFLQCAAFTGLVLIAGAVLVLAGDFRFPAPMALVPCLGACMVICYGERTLAGRLLSLRPVRWIGAISYSLYLWHWPIITLYRFNTGLTLSIREAAALTIASILVAATSYYLIEQPFLSKFRRKRSKPVLAVGASALAAMVGGTLTLPAVATAVGHPRGEIASISRYLKYQGEEHRYQFRPGECFATDRLQAVDIAGCIQIDPKRENVLVLGDSFGAHIWRALAEQFPHLNVMQLNASGCKPLVQPEGEPRCTALMRHGLEMLATSGQIDRIVLAARWRGRHMEKLWDTIAYLQDQSIAVTVIGPGVEYDGDFPRILAMAMIRGDSRMVERLRVLALDQLDRDMGNLVQASGADYISLYALECPQGRCRQVTDDGAPYHFDYGHLTYPAAQEMLAQIDQL